MASGSTSSAFSSSFFPKDSFLLAISFFAPFGLPLAGAEAFEGDFEAGPSAAFFVGEFFADMDAGLGFAWGEAAVAPLLGVGFWDDGLLAGVGAAFASPAGDNAPSACILDLDGLSPAGDKTPWAASAGGRDFEASGDGEMAYLDSGSNGLGERSENVGDSTVIILHLLRRAGGGGGGWGG